MNKVGKRLRMIPNINLGILMHIRPCVPTHMQNVHAHHIHIKRRKGKKISLAYMYVDYPRASMLEAQTD